MPKRWGRCSTRATSISSKRPGVVLLVAMIGAIVLTLRHKPYVKRQSIAEQIARTKASAIEIVKVRPGQGL